MQCLQHSGCAFGSKTSAKGFTVATYFNGGIKTIYRKTTCTLPNISDCRVVHNVRGLYRWKKRWAIWLCLYRITGKNAGALDNQLSWFQQMVRNNGGEIHTQFSFFGKAEATKWLFNFTCSSGLSYPLCSLFNVTRTNGNNKAWGKSGWSRDAFEMIRHISTLKGSASDC